MMCLGVNVEGLEAYNQHAKITRERVKSTLKSFHPMDEKIRHIVGEPWSDKHGANSRNQALLFYK